MSISMQSHRCVIFANGLPPSGDEINDWLRPNDVLICADEKYNFLDNLENPKVYRNYTDKIIDRIRKSNDPKLEKSVQIIKRIDERKLYKYVNGVFLEKEEHKIMFDLQDIADKSDGTLTAKDMILKLTKNNYGDGNKYPLEKMKFYQSDNNLKLV